MENKKIIKDKKNKIKKNNDKYKLFNILEFDQNNNFIPIEPIINLNIKKSSKKHKQTNKNNNKNNNDYLQEKIFNKKEIVSNIISNNKKDIINLEKKIIKSSNPIIQNEVIWYSNSLNSDELELKFKNKNWNKKNDIDNIIMNDNNNDTNKSNKEEINISVKQVYNKDINYKNCIFSCKKIESNIFVWDNSCNPNNFILLYLKNLYFTSNGKLYNPTVIEIYINDIFIKKIYSEFIKSNEEYNISYNSFPFPLLSNLKITIKIEDNNQIDQIFFKTYFEKIEDKIKIPYFDKNIYNEYISNTHILLYEGIDSDIIIKDECGYYQDIWIICENIIDNIKSISLINIDNILSQNIILLQDIPIYFFENKNNLLSYSFTYNDILMSGININNDNYINIKLNKNDNSKIKLYGNKLIIIKNDIKNNIKLLKN
jgi:hypothetical protein